MLLIKNKKYGVLLFMSAVIYSICSSFSYAYSDSETDKTVIKSFAKIDNITGVIINGKTWSASEECYSERVRLVSSPYLTDHPR